MKARILLFALLVPVIVFAENLFTNSSMDTTGGWQGDRRFETIEDNKVAVLEAKKNRTVSFSQDVDTRNATDLVLKLRYKTADYAGRGLQLRGSRPGSGSTISTRQLKADDQWHDMTWAFSEVRKSNRVKFEIELLEGTGKVFFDDVTVEAKQP
ncbi:MAG: hypothetical protein LC642_02815 [Verrucomicrobiaceae bacterium]|nr:hypothetical protein [Verrucomicrobiaceae bacterium]